MRDAHRVKFPDDMRALSDDIRYGRYGAARPNMSFQQRAQVGLHPMPKTGAHGRGRGTVQQVRYSSEQWRRYLQRNPEGRESPLARQRARLDGARAEQQGAIPYVAPPVD